MKHIFQLMLYAAIGFIVTYLVLEVDIPSSIPVMSGWLNIVLLALAAIATTLNISAFMQLKNKAGDRNLDADDLDRYMYTKFADMSLANSFSFVLGLLAMGVGVIAEMPLWFIVTSMALLIVAIILQFMAPDLMKQIYPERALPAVSEKDYADKLLAISDEGERHIMLEGLYKSFMNTSVLLVISLVILMLYSVATGNAQVLGMLLIAGVLLITNAQYILSIRKKG